MKKKVKVLKESIFKDKRGLLWTSWEKKKISLNFKHDKFSLSKKDVFRGLHYDSKTWKLVSCVYGKFFFVVVDCNPKSKHFHKVKTWILSAENNISILVPPYFANGHLCMSKECVFHYKLSYTGKYNDVINQKTLKWNDSSIKIKWPKRKFILSERDK